MMAGLGCWVFGLPCGHLEAGCSHLLELSQRHSNLRGSLVYVALQRHIMPERTPSKTHGQNIHRRQVL
jgi:hypothetical protein